MIKDKLTKNVSIVDDGGGYSATNNASQSSSTDEYIKKASQSSATEDYYQMARNQEYATLFDKEVALENAKSNALKYTQNAMSAQGLRGTGYGSSAQGGIYNAYMNKLGEASTEANTNIASINQQEKEANELVSAQRAGNITGMIQNANTLSELNGLLEDYGWYDGENIGVKTPVLDENGKETGKYTYEKPEGMTDDEWNQVKYYYAVQKDAIASSNSSSDPVTYINTLRNQAIDANGNIIDNSKYAELSSLVLNGKFVHVAGIKNGEGTTNNFKVKIDGEKYGLTATNQVVNSTIGNYLSGLFDNAPQNAQLVCYNNQLYVYKGTGKDTGWYPVEANKRDYNELYSYITNLIKTA